MGIGAWQTFKRTWKHQATMQIATLSVLIGTFTVLAIAILVQQNVRSFLNQWGDQLKVNVYLKEGANDKDVGDISKFLDQTKLFHNKRFLSKKEAAEIFKKRIENFAPSVVADLEYENPLPASFEMVVKGGIRSSNEFGQVVAVAEKLKKMMAVDEVSYGQGWVENYASVLKVFSVTSALFIIVLLSGALFVVGNSIRNSISQRRDEIEILELFGATRRAILWPYIFEGLFMGLVSAVVAVGITYVAYVWQGELVSGELAFWNYRTNVEFLSGMRIALIVITGAALGGVGSYLWARRISTGWAASEAVKQ